MRELNFEEIAMVYGGDGTDAPSGALGCCFMATAEKAVAGAAIGAATTGFTFMVAGFFVAGPKGAIAGAVGGAAIGAATGGAGAIVGYQAGCNAPI
jgi:hypothetical protein